MRWPVWCSAFATIALSTSGAAQVRVDTLSILPEIRSAAWIARSLPIVNRLFVGNLHVVLVRQTDDGTLLPLSPDDLSAMRLSPERVFAIAIANARRRLTPFSIEMPAASPEMSGMRAVEGQSIETSRLLLDDEWRGVARQLGGPIVAVAPITGSLIFGRDSLTAISQHKSVPAAQYLEIAAGVLMPYGKRDDILSAVVLRWTDAGWTAVPPMTADERRALNDRPQDTSVPDQTSVSTPAPVAPTDTTMPPPRAKKPLVKAKKP